MASSLKPHNEHTLMTDFDGLSVSSSTAASSNDTENLSNPSDRSKGDDTLYPLHKSHSMPPPKATSDGDDDGDGDEEKKGDTVPTAAYSIGSAAYNYMASFYGPQQLLDSASKQDPKSQSLSAMDRITAQLPKPDNVDDALSDHLRPQKDQIHQNDQSPPQWMVPDLINYPLRRRLIFVFF